MSDTLLQMSNLIQTGMQDMAGQMNALRKSVIQGRQPERQSVQDLNGITSRVPDNANECEQNHGQNLVTSHRQSSVRDETTYLGVPITPHSRHGPAHTNSQATPPMDQ